MAVSQGAVRKTLPNRKLCPRNLAKRHCPSRIRKPASFALTERAARGEGAEVLPAHAFRFCARWDSAVPFKVPGTDGS